MCIQFFFRYTDTELLDHSFKFKIYTLEHNFKNGRYVIHSFRFCTLRFERLNVFLFILRNTFFLSIHFQFQS